MSDTDNRDGKSKAAIKKAQLKELQEALARLINEVPLGLDTVTIGEFSGAEIDSQVSSLQHLLAGVGGVFQKLRDANVLDAANPISALTAKQIELTALFAARHSDSVLPSDLTAAEVRASGDSALALKYIKGIWIDHPEQRLAFAKLEYAYNSSSSGEPHNMMMLAPSFAGKTETLILTRDKFDSSDEPYEVMFDPTHGEIRVRRQRAVVVECPGDGVFTKMIRKLLTTLGDPYADDTKPQVLEPRAREFLEKAGTRILAFDDINNGIQVGQKGDALRSQESIFNLTKAIRAFEAELVLSKLNVSIVLSGVPVAQELRVANEQLANRFRETIHLNPYVWSRARPDQALLFMSQVQSLLEDIPLAKQTPPTDKDFPLIAKLHWATDGNIGHLVRIVKDAAIYALALGHPRLTEDHLAYAFDSSNMPNVLPKNDSTKMPGASPKQTRHLFRTNPFRTLKFEYPLESEYTHIKAYSDLIR